MNFMVHSYINLYAIEQGSGTLLYGESLPKMLLPVHHAAHFMTLDKIVGEAKASAVFTMDANEQLVQNAIKSFTKKNEKVWISDFDGFMTKGNPIVKN